MVPGAVILFVSGAWMTPVSWGGWAFMQHPWLAGMILLFVFEFVEGNHRTLVNALASSYPIFSTLSFGNFFLIDLQSLRWLCAVPDDQQHHNTTVMLMIAVIIIAAFMDVY